MKPLMLALVISAFAIGSAAGQGAPVPGTCESKAVSKDGKPLAGAEVERGDGVTAQHFSSEHINSIVSIAASIGASFE